MTTTRADVVDEIARYLCAIVLDHPTRVAIDGITASGKSTLAAELTAAAQHIGRPAIHLTMDGFHNPRARRYRQGRESADGYYEDAYDFDAFITRVLEPLGPNGSLEFTSAVIDLASDTPIEKPNIPTPADTILIVDGSFLQRPPTDQHWDATVFVDTDFAIARARGIARDAKRLGGPDAAGSAFDQRYHAASRRYIEEVAPTDTATVLLDNNDPTHPRIVRPLPT